MNSSVSLLDDTTRQQIVDVYRIVRPCVNDSGKNGREEGAGSWQYAEVGWAQLLRTDPDTDRRARSAVNHAWSSPQSPDKRNGRIGIVHTRATHTTRHVGHGDAIQQCKEEAPARTMAAAELPFDAACSWTVRSVTSERVCQRDVYVLSDRGTSICMRIAGAGVE